MPVEQDITYAAIAGRDLKLDLFRPEGGEVPTRTAVILVHGGGWMAGERGMIAPLAQQFADRGYLAVTPEYRLVGEAAWPAQLDDVVAATEWVADNADHLGVDVDRIVIGGSSAGGHLALMATAKLGGKARIAAVLSLFSASELTLEQPAPKGAFGAVQLVGPGAGETELKAASPLHQVNEAFPPVFLLHGGGDWMIDPQASLNLYQRLVEVGVPAELHIVAGGLHEFVEEPGMRSPMVSEMALFMDRLILNPDRWAAESDEHNLFAKGPEAVMALMKQMLEQG